MTASQRPVWCSQRVCTCVGRLGGEVHGNLMNDVDGAGRSVGWGVRVREEWVVIAVSGVMWW